ncbi:hypothetical protein [Sporolactobacillus inulinus]|uniref:Uncharacterized protein n=1 Tax=Sporolactobacillus inulinus CASD TaxID=1069536 RepID=A0A0U1QKU8_9BACL|nr:hypothetical protein [Sporolactobacillus inulinus]KLI01402.1 hypothetical protein SINU_13665 [Sporolactobacillus inulinus CASD]GEB77309.1 hypothetical protein SIN01_16540 [Sporolactobacillus inulinus]
MVSAIGFIVYALLCLISGIIVWSKTDHKVIVSYFLSTHLACLIMGVLMINSHLPLLLVVIILSAALVGRIANGRFIFDHVNVLHHLLTAAFFVVLLFLSA